MKIKTNHSGFTLIELMVVVALIGILSSIAIPNFRKYRNKSRQIEAKLALAALYTALQTYRMENEDYTVCMRQIGFEVESDKRYYAVGLGLNLGKVSLRTAYGTACLFVPLTPGMPLSNSDVVYSSNMVVDTSDLPGSAEFNYVGIPNDSSSFLATAVGNIKSLPFDKWTINHNKTLINTNPGF